MDIEKVFKNNDAWIKDQLAVDKDYFNKMCKEQNPDILYIGCSDSRVSAEELMGLRPGEAFIHRNVANMVTAIDLNAMTVINYAVTQLKVKHVIICGHYGCGGIKLALENKDHGILNPWLRNIRDVYRLHKQELNDIKDECQKYKRLVELNVQEQCINLIKTAAVQKADHTRGIKVHGWVFDMENGKLIDLKINFDETIKEIETIYKLTE